MKTHELKTWTETFESTWNGSNVHQVRRKDRDYRVGDALVLREWNPKLEVNARYTGRVIKAIVTYISEPGTFGLPDDICVMSLGAVECHE